MPSLIPTYDRWMKESTPSMSFGVRSSDLKAVDQALLNYWSDQSETRLAALRKALLFWEEKKSHFEQAGNSLYRRPTRDWRQDIRNSKGVVSLLHDALFASTRPFSREELAGLEILRAASLDPVKDLLRGKQISVKKTAIASLISSAYKEAKDVAGQLSAVPIPKVDPIHLIRIFIQWVKYKLPSFNIDFHIRNLLAWYKGLNLDLPNINFPELFFKWLRIHIPDLSIHLPDIFAYFKFKFPSLNLSFFAHLQLKLPNFPSISINLPDISIPDLDFLLPTLPDIRFNLAEIFGVDFGILELFPDLLSGFLESLHDIYLEAVPFVGPAKSAGKAFVGYSKAILARYHAYSWEKSNAETFAANGASDAFDAVLNVIAIQANRTAANATVDLVTAGAQTGGVFLDGGTATGAAIAVGNRLAKFIITMQVFINDYKEMTKANEVMKSWSEGGSQSVVELFKTCPLLGCFVLHCCDTSAIFNGVSDQLGYAGFVSEVNSQHKKARAVKDAAYGFITVSKFEIAGMPKLARAETDPLAAAAAVKNAYEFRAKGKLKSWGFI